MANGKNRSAGTSLSPKERRQLLFWGSILLIAMLGLIYLITPSSNPPQKSTPAKRQTGHANRSAPASLTL
jgi:hypothetical protein